MADTFRHATRYFTTTLPLGLGSLRRRRYEYLPPVGWKPLAKRHSVRWLPPDFPKNPSSITVFDAKPASTAPSLVLERNLIEAVQHDLSDVVDRTIYEAYTENGLKGAYELVRGKTRDGADGVILRCTLTDAQRYAYNVRLEACEPHARDAAKEYDALIRTIMPVPRPSEGDVHEETQKSTLQWIE
jgi:hypothetical protein